MREERKSAPVSDRNIEILTAVVKGDKNGLMQVIEKHKNDVHDLGSVTGLRANIRIFDA